MLEWPRAYSRTNMTLQNSEKKTYLLCTVCQTKEFASIWLSTNSESIYFILGSPKSW